MIDELDRKILNMLIADCRQPNRVMVNTLADEGHRISQRGLGKRISRLKKKGIITGFTTMVDMKKVDMGVPRLVTIKLSSPKNFVERLNDMKKYLKDAPFCDFSARSDGGVDWIELKIFNTPEQANTEADLYRTWFGDIIEDYRSYDLEISKFGWQLFQENDFDFFMNSMQKKLEEKPVIEIKQK